MPDVPVDNARRLGWSWQDIAARLGVTGLVPPILAALGTPAATLRAAVADACRATGEPPQR